MNILTEREFLSRTSVEATQVNEWIAGGIMRPIQTLDEKLIYLKKHVQLAENIHQLTQHGLSLQQIRPFVENETVDIEQVLQQQNVLERTIEFYQSLPYDEIVSRCQAERIVGFRRMSREEMEICLAYPDRRAEMSELVRERNRRRTRPTTSAPQQTAEPVQTTPVSAQTDARGEIMNLTYTQLVQKAQAARIPNFRRMTKTELQFCFLASEQDVQQLVEVVRERTRQRYGSGSESNVQNHELVGIDMETVGFDASNPFYGSVMTAPFGNFAPDTTPVQDTVVEDEVEEVQEVQDIVVEEETPEVEPVVEQTTPQSDEVPYSYEELQAMNSKRVAEVVRDHLDIKYFRRMTKEELIICIFEPERREEMVENAAARYELYRGRRYGQNNR